VLLCNDAIGGRPGQVLVLSNMQAFEVAFTAKLSSEGGGEGDPLQPVWTASPLEGLLQPTSSQEITVQWTPPSLAPAEFKVAPHPL
jgi:hypothetical protein